MSNSPMRTLADVMRQSGLIRFIEHFQALYPTSHLKDLVVDRIGPNRLMEVNGREVTNFGSDSFLGLDQDPRVLEAVRRGLDKWGAHNGASRAFSSVRANVEAEEKLAAWLGTEATLIYPSVTLANMGAIPGLVGRQDAIALDEHAHNSMQEAAKIARSNGAKVATFAHNDPDVEAYVLKKLGLKAEPIATQVIPRDRHAVFLTTMAIIFGMLERIGTEIRHLQRTEVLEAEEPFTKGQKGSSAMPHKRNPIGCENICGLARLGRANAMAALEDIALWHERDISHSSVERVILPDTTTILDYALNRMSGILRDLQVYPLKMEANLKKTESFLASEKIMLALVGTGLDRQVAYGMVQKNALNAWVNGKDFRALIEGDKEITGRLKKGELTAAFDTKSHYRHVNTLFKRVGL